METGFGKHFWKLMVTFGNGLKLFLLSLFNSCNYFLTLAHTCSCSVMHSANCHTMASVHSSPPDAWVEHSRHASDGSVQSKNTLASPNVTTHTNNKKICLAKAKWTTTEEAALVTVLSDQKCIRNSSKSGFKGTVWRMVEAAVRVIGEGPSKVQSSARHDTSR